MATLEQKDLSPADAKTIAQEGFLFGLPLVYIALQADTMTNVASRKVGARPSISSTTTASFPMRRTTRSSA